MTIQQYTINRIKYYIIEKDLSVAELARRSVLPPSTLKNILYGNSNNTGIFTIQWICYGLGITIQDFFSEYVMGEIWWE